VSAADGGGGTAANGGGPGAPGHDSAPRLIRALGRWDLTAVGVNQVIGSGIFVLPATVALLVGAPASVWPWLAAGLANALIVLCFAEAGTRFRHAGGPLLYTATAFGPFAGFLVGWMMWLTRVASQAALANAFALYVGFFWHGATQGTGRVLVIAATIASLALINYRGVKWGAWTINLFTIGKLVPLGIFIALGIFYVDWGAFDGLLTPTMSGFGQSVLLLMFAFGGYELITIPAGEARSPRRDAPRALLLTIGIVCAIYILVQIIAVGTLPGLANSTTPLADSALLFLGTIAGTFIAIGGLLSIGGSNAGTMLAGPRLTFALAENRQLPAIFAHVHPRYHTPDFSILVYASIAMLLALTGTFEQLAAVSAVARLVFYIGTCAAVPVLRMREAVETHEGAFQLPGGMTIPLLALGVNIAIIVGADQRSLAAGGAAMIIGTMLYVLGVTRH
jgi:amino acid transporter